MRGACAQRMPSPYLPMTVLRFLLLCFLVCLCSAAHAGVIPSVSGQVRTVGYSGVLIESHAVTGHVPDLSKIRGEWSMLFGWDGNDTFGATYESTLWMEDETGAKVSIVLDGGGPAVTEVVEEYQVSLDSQTTTDNHTFAITFRPQGRLVAQKRYTIKAKWRSKPAGGSYGSYVQVPVDTSAPNTALYFHFDNTTSGDAALNVRTQVTLTSWTRRWMLAASPSQNTFVANVEVASLRLDDFNAPAASDTVNTEVKIALKRVATGSIVWTSAGQTVTQSVPSHTGGIGPLAELASEVTTTALPFSVPAGVLIPGENYIPILQATHNDIAGGPVTAINEGERAFSPQRLLRLSGRIYFGTLLTYGNAISNDPVEDLDVGGPTPATILVVSPGQGILPDASPATYGGVSLDVEIEPDGDAVYNGGAAIPVSGVTGTVTYQGVKFTRSGITLGTGGATAASMSVHLPRGLSYTYTAGSRVMKTKITTPDMPLEGNLLPAGSAAFSFSGSTYISLERLPLVFATPGLSFNTATGRFSFIPSSVAFDSFFELSTLETYGAGNLLEWPAGVPLHAGNDQVFRSAKLPSPVTTVEVSAAADGAAFVNALELAFNAGAHWTHFPQHWLVSTSGPGTQDSLFRITNDVVDQSSMLGGVDGVLGYYTPDPKPEAGKPACPAGSPAVGPKFFALINAEEELQFLADGSLHGSMTAFDNAAGPGARLNAFMWGTWGVAPDLFAHQISQNLGTGFVGQVMLPSHFLPWRSSDVSGLPVLERPAAAHLSGRGIGLGGTQAEHPHQPSYLEGAADYAGFNIRRQGQAGFQATSRLGGSPPVSYNLLNETKLYVRSSGISGTIQSSEDLAFPINGFDFGFDGIKLAFLDNGVAGSKLDGGITVGGAAPGYPCQFTVDFQNLRLWANGALDKGEVDPTQGGKTLAYWRTDITPLTLSFVQPSPCDGPGGETFLALGVQAVLPSVAGTDPLNGILGFRGNGTLVAKGDQTEQQFAITKLDSRFRVPGDVKVKGPGASAYSVAPVCGAYLNRWPGAGQAPATGFVNVAGAVDVPFFENLTVHLHATADSNASVNAAVHVMQPDGDLGPFSLAEFDPENLGVPSINDVPVAVDTYRSGADYRVHAVKRWLGLVDFDFPLTWNSSLRRFEMSDAQAVTQNLLVADVKSRVRSLTPTTADLKFRAALGVQLPSIDANQLMGEALEGVGIGSPLSAILSAVPGFSTVLQDLATFEQALADTPEMLVRQPLIEAVAATRASISVNADATTFRNALVSQLNTLFNQPALSSSAPTSWKQGVMTRLDKVNSVSTSLKSIIFDANTVKNMANALATVLGGAQAAQVPEEVDETLNTAYGALTLLQNGISEVRNGINAIDLTPNWSPVIDLALPDLPATPLARTNAEIAEAVLARFLGDSASATISEEMRVHLGDVRDRLRGSVDSIFAGVNEMIQGEAGNVLPVPVPGIADLADLQFGKIDGQARINGDSLHELRLDADISMKMGPSLDFHGYVLYRDLNSDTPATACRASAGVAAELTLGASTQFPFGAPPSPTELEVEAKFAFNELGGLNGLAGRFGVKGSGFKLGVLTIKQAELGFGFGGGDAYLYGKGAGQSDWADIEAAVFFGRTCNLDAVMQRVDSQVSELLSRPQVSAVTTGGSYPAYGLYAFGYGSISVNALIGIPPSPMLNLKAGAGMGAFYFVRQQDAPPNPAEPYAAVIGLRQDFGVSGEVLCLADISARLSLVGAAGFTTDDPVNLLPVLSDPLSHPILGSGQADVSLEVGVSPFDFTLHKTLRMNFSYSPLKFDLDL